MSNLCKRDKIIAQYSMEAHPEGGFYVETFRSTTMVNTDRGLRAASTAIYFLMCNNSISRLHKIISDEVWHFYSGCSITIIELDESTGGFRTTVLGPNIELGEELQFVVKGGTWFGSFPNNDGIIDEFSLVGCTVAPGFEFCDFELGSYAALSTAFPIAAEAGVISKLTVGLP